MMQVQLQLSESFSIKDTYSFPEVLVSMRRLEQWGVLDVIMESIQKSLDAMSVRILSPLHNSPLALDGIANSTRLSFLYLFPIAIIIIVNIGLFRRSLNLIEHIQRIVDGSIHIEILVRRQSSHEVNLLLLLFLLRELLILLVQLVIFRVGHGIVRIALVRAILLHGYGILRRLVKVVLVLHYTGIVHLRTGIVHDAVRLEVSRVLRYVRLEIDGTVLELTQFTILKISIDGSGEYRLAAASLERFSNLKVVHPQHHIDVLMIQHLCEPLGISLRWQELVPVREVSRIKVIAHGNSGGNQGIQLLGLLVPLLLGVRFEDLRKQFLPHTRLGHLLCVRALVLLGTGDLHRLEPLVHLA
mmetsp:Transcript_17808/g.42878  ORF Transcript_17808/g.42878 Transcript_17808/m.42878 type:complete len:357 (-) Transcript_17808:716-1786(-)